MLCIYFLFFKLQVHKLVLSPNLHFISSITITTSLHPVSFPLKKCATWCRLIPRLTLCLLIVLAGYNAKKNSTTNYVYCRVLTLESGDFDFIFLVSTDFMATTSIGDSDGEQYGNSGDGSTGVYIFANLSFLPKIRIASLYSQGYCKHPLGLEQSLPNRSSYCLSIQPKVTFHHYPELLLSPVHLFVAVSMTLQLHGQSQLLSVKELNQSCFYRVIVILDQKP